MDIKRAFDITFASAGIVAAAPVALATCFIMAATNKSSPIYTQTRLGQDKKPFTIFKIKSMTDETDDNGIPLPDEQRTSTIGKIIRKARIDESPQLFNILRGDMSVVGPRPVPAYSQLSGDDKRYDIKPGLTGPAQIAGANSLSAAQILELDHGYVDCNSLVKDIKICALTPISLITNRDVPHFGNDTLNSGMQNIEP